jgi:hypothetical protein
MANLLIGNLNSDIKSASCTVNHVESFHHLEIADLFPFAKII